MQTIDQLRKKLPEVEEKLGYTFKNSCLLELALTHRSFLNENREAVSEHNERLEFLGDAILGLIISDFLYLRLPNCPEGELSYLRSRLVEAATCSYYLQKIDLEEALLMGKGESMNQGKGRATLLADLFEALIGAIYLDGGIESARTFFFNQFEADTLEILRRPHRNWKAELQDFCQKKYQTPPCYEVIKEEGPDHAKIFTIAVKHEDQILGEGTGSSKKEAEQSAAQHAIEKLGL